MERCAKFSAQKALFCQILLKKKQGKKLVFCWSSFGKKFVWFLWKNFRYILSYLTLHLIFVSLPTLLFKTLYKEGHKTFLFSHIIISTKCQYPHHLIHIHLLVMILTLVLYQSISYLFIDIKIILYCQLMKSFILYYVVLVISKGAYAGAFVINFSLN